MDRIKRLLALAALACMAVYIILTVGVLISGTAEQNLVWTMAPLSAFLLLGCGCLLLNYLQKRAEEQRQRENNEKQ